MCTSRCFQCTDFHKNDAVRSMQFCKVFFISKYIVSVSVSIPVWGAFRALRPSGFPGFSPFQRETRTECLHAHLLALSPRAARVWTGAWPMVGAAHRGPGGKGPPRRGDPQRAFSPSPWAASRWGGGWGGVHRFVGTFRWWVRAVLGWAGLLGECSLIPLTSTAVQGEDRPGAGGFQSGLREASLAAVRGPGR